MQKFLRGVFPGHGRGTLIWEHFWDTLGNAAGRFVEPAGQQIGLGVGVAPAGEAPLAVEVEGVVAPRPGRRATRASRRALKVVEKRALLEENCPP